MEQPNPNPDPESVDALALPTTLFTFSITAQPQTFNALCRQAWGLPQVRKKRETAYDMNSKHNKFGIYGKLLRYNNIMWFFCVVAEMENLYEQLQDASEEIDAFVSYINS